MAIGNLGDKISSDDVDMLRDKRNPPDMEPGFEEDSFGDFSGC